MICYVDPESSKKTIPIYVGGKSIIDNFKPASTDFISNMIENALSNLKLENTE